jgi:hypothetical protein
VVPAWSYRLSWSPAILAVVRQKLHLSRCSDFQSQLSLARVAWAAVLATAEKIKAGSFDGLAAGASGKQLNDIFSSFS